MNAELLADPSCPILLSIRKQEYERHIQVFIKSNSQRHLLPPSKRLDRLPHAVAFLPEKQTQIPTHLYIQNVSLIKHCKVLDETAAPAMVMQRRCEAVRCSKGADAPASNDNDGDNSVLLASLLFII